MQEAAFFFLVPNEYIRRVRGRNRPRNSVDQERLPSFIFSKLEAFLSVTVSI
jgi:hypothetical protein